MVLPLVIGAIAVGSAIAQYLSSAEGRRLAAAERRRLEQMVQDVQNPSFDWSKLDPATYQVVAKYQPQVADFVAEQAPQLTKMDSADAMASRDAQREALNRLRAQSQGNDPLADAELADNLAQAATANRGRNDAVREDFSRRGQAGGTSEMLAQLLGTQQSNEQAATGARQSFIEAEKRKLQALRDSTSLAGAVRDDEFRMERGNNDLINGFNLRMATRRQGWADNAAGTMNDAQKFNVGNQQDIANRNVTTGNQFAVQERDRRDKLTQQGFDNDMSKVKTLAGVTDMARSDALGSARDTNSAIAGGSEGAQTAIAYGASQRQPQQSQQEQNGYTNATQNLTAQPNYSNTYEEPGTDPLNRKYRTSRATA